MDLAPCNDAADEIERLRAENERLRAARLERMVGKVLRSNAYNGWNPSETVRRAVALLAEIDTVRAEKGE